MSTDLTIRDDQTYWTERQVAGLRQIGVGNAAPADLAVFFHYAVKTGLDPFARQIYMIERQGKQTIQTGIDGLRLIARRAADQSHGTFGMADILWCGEDGKWVDVWLAETPPAAAKAVVYRDGQPFSAVVLFREYAGRKRDGSLMSMWATKGALMLGKVAEASALRKAYPQDLSGLYASEEMAAPIADTPRRVTAEELTRPRPKVDEPVDADVVTDDPPPVVNMTTGEVKDLGEALVDPLGPQMKALHASLNEVGLTDRDKYLAWLTQGLGRDVTSTKTLTVGETSRALDALRDMKERPFEEAPEEPT